MTEPPETPEPFGRPDHAADARAGGGQDERWPAAWDAPRRRRNPVARAFGALVGVLVAAAVVALGLAWLAGVRPGDVVGADRCLIESGDQVVRLAPEQAEHATTIAAIATQRGLPARAVTIALATAYQESDLYNIDYGDRDSLGLFQQRPSQGWGTEAEVQDPVYAANAFYDALEQVDGYRDLDVTVAAQEVQRSAFPDAYADHEADARLIASALTGWSPATFSCRIGGSTDVSVQPAGSEGLTPRAQAVRDELTAAFGELPTGGYEPDGVSSGRVEGSAHYDGRAVDVFFRPHTEETSKRSGWAAAHWAVANADRLGVATVIYDDRIWSARRSGQGWREYTHPSGDTENPVLRHLDHVHIDVVAGS